MVALASALAARVPAYSTTTFLQPSLDEPGWDLIQAEEDLIQAKEDLILAERDPIQAERDLIQAEQDLIQAE